MVDLMIQQEVTCDETPRMSIRNLLGVSCLVENDRVKEHPNHGFDHSSRFFLDKENKKLLRLSCIETYYGRCMKLLELYVSTSRIWRETIGSELRYAHRIRYLCKASLAGGGGGGSIWPLN